MRQQGADCCTGRFFGTRTAESQISFVSLSRQRTVSGWSDSSVTRRAATYLVPSV